MKNTDDEKRGDTDHDAGQMIFHQKFHSSTLLCFSEQNTCPVGKTDTEHAAGNVPSMSSSFAAKIRLSRGQKQIYLYFAEAEYLRRSQRLGLSFGKSKFYLHFAEAGRSQRYGKPRENGNLFTVFRGASYLLQR
jgi:hypothetical protein